MKIKEALRRFGEKSAMKSVDSRSFPWASYQPKLPIKIRDRIKMQEQSHKTM